MKEKIFPPFFENYFPPYSNLTSHFRDHQKLTQNEKKFNPYNRLLGNITHLLQIGDGPNDGKHVELACNALEALIVKQAAVASMNKENNVTKVDQSGKRPIEGIDKNGSATGKAKYHTVPTGRSKRKYERRKKPF